MGIHTNMCIYIFRGIIFSDNENRNFVLAASVCMSDYSSALRCIVCDKGCRRHEYSWPTRFLMKPKCDFMPTIVRTSFPHPAVNIFPNSHLVPTYNIFHMYTSCSTTCWMKMTPTAVFCFALFLFISSLLVVEKSHVLLTVDYRHFRNSGSIWDLGK